MILDTILIYLIFSSAVLVYGTGLKQILDYSADPKRFLFQMIRIMVTIVLSVFVSRGITVLFLVPARLQELFPFVCIIFTILFAIITEKLCELFFNIEVKEIAITICSVIIGVNEGLTMLHSILIGVLCSLSFFLFLPFLYAIRCRMKYSQQHIDFRKGALVFLSIALIMLVLFSMNVSWLNLGAD